MFSHLQRQSLTVIYSIADIHFGDYMKLLVQSRNGAQ